MRNAFPNEFDDRGLLAGALGAVRSRPVDALAVALAAACVAMILINALALQEGRRPPVAPSVSQLPPAQVAPLRSELVAQIQTALAERDYFDGVVDGLMGARTGTAIRAFEEAQGLQPTGEPSDRVLAAALTAPVRKADASPVGTWRVAPPVPSAKPTPSPAVTGSTTALATAKVVAMQRALAKLGYGPVTADGKLGAATQNAIRSFERGHKMPATGEPSPPVLRALQTASGAPLQ